MTEATTTPKARKTTKAKPKAAKAANARASKAKAAPKAPKKTPIELASGIITELTRANFEQTVETAKAVLKSGDIRSAVELQNEFLRAAFKRNLDAAREINEIAVIAVREAVGPYAEKFTEAVERVRAA